MLSLLTRLAILFCCIALNAVSAPLPKLQVVTEEWVPYNYANDDGVIVGRATKKVREVLDAAGVEYDIRLYPWARSMKLAKTQPNTMIYSIYRNAEREKLFEWACPLMRPVRQYLFKLKSRDDIQVNSIEEAKKYVISVVRGSVVHEYLVNQGFEAGVNLDITADPSASQKKLVAGRIDFLLTTEYTMYERLRLMGVDYSNVEPALEVRNSSDRRACMAFQLDTNKVLIDKIKRALAEHNKMFIGP
ncbi:transporter substrate-binding domain-containing protein [Pseudoalteromonas sp. SMS1]|uniref:substrate-binding periplasmic protein n=1 Tax=Pseudoalteromonas sp. SMS1 TaxID=2908894 RepID=UPI001F20D2D1|nr:transporter substrate-binding domain-containing protein [Pseudoalteromonas sp. SMS1]MCF2857609.1 transporter substrate-binding domain-containing protein [Pseudoalteromonas sp. SMS1]